MARAVGEREDHTTERLAHAREWPDVARALDVDVATGLSQGEARARLARFGANALRPPAKARAWRILADQFRSAVVLLLVLAGGLALAFGDTWEALAILVVVLVNAGIGFATEVKAVRSMEALRKMTTVPARARRDGETVGLPAADLVPGDVVVLEAGDLVPADLRIVEAGRLEADESTLTGESLPVRKHTRALAAATRVPDRACMLFQGTSLTRGAALGLVVATGERTHLARIARLAEEAVDPPSALQRRLDRLGRQMVWAIFVIGASVVGLGLASGRPPFLMVQTAVALAVAAIPEGLPAVATLALARGMLVMARRDALVRRLAAVETLGSTNVLCVDKTGTLTHNRLVADRLWTAGLDEPAHAREALEAGALCNNASLLAPGEGVGDPLEVALLELAAARGVDVRALRAAWPREREEPFDPATKMMATLHRGASGWRLAVKGAPEAVIAAARDAAGPGGRAPLGPAERAAWLARNDALARQGFRVLAIAQGEPATPDAPPFEGLTLLALVPFVDPPREDVPGAIAECHRAGIRVVMVTGDHAGTARHVAQRVGIGVEAGVVRGSDLPHEGVDPGTAGKLATADVFARVVPEQKVSIVALHQSAGNVVAMTGDGVNDAPALRSADVGIAMGRRGTQVAREAADVVLRDDAFPTIVVAIRHGRAIFHNIRRFILYLLSCNVSEILVVALAIAADAPLALLPLQILFLNLVTDVFPALALGMGRAEARVMERPPRPAGEPFLRSDHWLAIAAYGALLAAAVLTAFAVALGPLRAGDAAAVTVSFLTLGFAQLWHVLNMRGADAHWLRNSVTRNPHVWGALALCAGLLLAAVHLPPLAAVLSVARLDARLWTLVLGMSLGPLLVGQLALLALGWSRRRR